MSNEFDCKEFHERTRQEYETYQMTLQQTQNKKEMALLHTNYFQNCLKDSMEKILQSKEGRRIPVKLIISILKDRGTLNPVKANDAMKICDVRDWFTHRINVKSIEEDAEELIRTINTRYPVQESMTDAKENTDITVRRYNESENFDLYGMLDLICSDLYTIVKNGNVNHNNKPKTNNTS